MDMYKQPIGYIINEGIDVEPNATIISSSNANRVIAEAILQEAEEDNRNGRFYTAKDLKREIACPRTQELIGTGYLRAEIGHPQSTEVSRQQTIDPDKVCAKFLKLWMDGNKVMCHFRGTNNDKGKFIDDDLRDGDKPSWSLRALGTINNMRGHAIVENLKLITYDNVIYPSHKGAYTQRLVTESASVNYDKYGTTESGIIIPILNEQIVSYIKTESANISTILNNIDVLYESIILNEDGRSVKMIDKFGNIMIINLENHISNEIMDYCFKTISK